MDLNNVTYQGPSIDDAGLLAELPTSLQSLLRSLNGFVQFGGGLHLRGACLTPDWHALRPVWHGSRAFHVLYGNVQADWVPFAEDCVGDQFFLSNGQVLRLSAETGEVEPLRLKLSEFLHAANAEPVEFLSMEPLLSFQRDTGALPEGHLLMAYPPFCTNEAKDGVSLKPVPAVELHAFHAELAQSLPRDGGKLRIRAVD